MSRKKVDYEVNENGCFVCTSHRPHKSGYPRIRENGSQKYLHRFIYEQCFGTIEPRLVVRHKYDNRMCINPEHLELGTVADNNRDTALRGRTARGEKNSNAKFKEQDIRNIRQSQLPTLILAKKYGVSWQTISRIRRGLSWRHVA